MPFKFKKFYEQKMSYTTVTENSQRNTFYGKKTCVPLAFYYR